jgi:hypothetical protein
LLWFLGLLQVIGEFNVNWPEWISNYIFRTASLLDFDVVRCALFAADRSSSPLGDAIRDLDADK